MKVDEYYRKLGWRENPFITIASKDVPVVKHKVAYDRIQDMISFDAQTIAVISPIGYGKTSLINYIVEDPFILRERKIKYVISFDSCPEKRDFMDKILKQVPFYKKFRKKFYESSFGRDVNPALGSDKMLLLFDEAQDYNPSFLHWLNGINDHASNILMIFFGQRKDLMVKLTEDNALRDRVKGPIEIPVMDDETLNEIIKKRIVWVGGQSMTPFTEDGIRRLTEQVKVPREVLSSCELLLRSGVEGDSFEWNSSFVESHISGPKKPMRVAEKKTDDRVEESVFRYSIGDFSPTQQIILKEMLRSEYVSVQQLEKRTDMKRTYINQELRKLRGLDQVEIKRRPGVDFPAVIRPEKRVVDGRRQYIYQLSDNARRILGS